MDEAIEDAPAEEIHAHTLGMVSGEDDMALVAVPTSNLEPVTGQNVFQAPMFPQLEIAVNTMSSMLQQQMMAMLGAVLPARANQTPLPIPEARQVCHISPLFNPRGCMAMIVAFPNIDDRP